MKLPTLIINFKTYPQARGEKGLSLAKQADAVADEFGASIIVAPQLPNVTQIAQQVDIPVFAQHFDHNKPGSATGHIDAHTLKEGGIDGSLLNHSERQLESSNLEQSIQIANELELETVVCASTAGLSHALSSFGPDAVAMEPPELIGGDVSVTTRPEVVKKSVRGILQANPDTIPLVGAGVKTADHLEEALNLGSKGVLLASGVVKHEDPRSVMEDMAKILVEY